MKNLTRLLVLCLLICTVVAITACSHKHEFSTDWQSDASGHWHACADNGCKQKSDEAAHIYGEGVVTASPTEDAEGVMTYECAICGYEKNEAIAKLEHKHTWESDWSFDGTHHWHASTCGHDVKDMEEHIFDDGFVEKPATEEEDGLIIYTCLECGVYYEETLSTQTHIHVFADEYSYDDTYHWYDTTCGHTNIKGKSAHKLSAGTVTEEPTEDKEGLKCYYCDSCDYVKEEVLAKLTHVHVFDKETLTCKCGLVHTTCEICESCSTAECPDCRVKCAFIDGDRIIYFAPSITLGAPEGPDGKKPTEEGSYVYDTSITASHTVLESGANAVLISLPNGTLANSGVSFLNNKDASIYGQAGYNCGIPVVGGYAKYIRLYFTNHGNSDITFKYSGIYYYYDYGKVELTLKAGESAVVIMKTLLGGASTGINHQIVFTEDVAAGASLSVWGEHIADENLSGVSISVPATKLSFVLGETFSAEGLILKANGANYGSVYVTGNYKTNLDGHVFTADDVAAGNMSVTVNFAGFTATYTITVNDHLHDIEYVEAEPVTHCADGVVGTDGFEAYYHCKVEGCDMYFTDATGKNETSAPDVVSCHVESLALPGEPISCTECDKDLGTKSMENWVFCNPPAKIHSYKGGFSANNVSLAYGDVNDLLGTLVTFKQGTVGGSDKGFKFYCENNLDEDNGIPMQHKLLNVGNSCPDGSTRRLMVRFVNYGTEDVTLTLKNDNYGSISYITVTVPAGGSVIGETILRKQNGANYYELYLNNTEALKSDVKIGMYGYFEILEGETNAPTIYQEATTTSFKVGETFTCEGLVLNATVPNLNENILYVATGYTTSFDGHTFTDSDVGTKTVTVMFAGKTCTYEITVTAE